MKKLSILFIVFLFISVGCGTSREWYEKDNSLAAYNATIPHIYGQLTSPQTAVFPAFNERRSHTKKQEDNIYLIESWVDEFGNGREIYFEARIQQIAEREFDLLSLKFDEY